MTREEYMLKMDVLSIEKREIELNLKEKEIDILKFRNKYEIGKLKMETV